MAGREWDETQGKEQRMKESGKHNKKNIKKPVLFTVIILAVLACNHVFGWSARVGGTDTLEFLGRMAQEHMAAAVFAYTAVTVIGCVVLTLPGVTFAILAGLLFGPVLGTLCCTVAATLGAMAAFLAGRFFLKDSIKPVVMKNKYLKKWLFDESGKNELFVLMITRMVPLFPYNLQNFAYGVTDIPFGTYSIYSFVFMLPGTAMYTVGTAGLADRENRVLYFSITAVLAAVVIGLGMFFKKRYVLRETEERLEEDEREIQDKRQR